MFRRRDCSWGWALVERQQPELHPRGKNVPCYSMEMKPCLGLYPEEEAMIRAELWGNDNDSDFAREKIV